MIQPVSSHMLQKMRGPEKIGRLVQKIEFHGCAQNALLPIDCCCPWRMCFNEDVRSR